MADAIKKEHGIDPELIEGSGGIFDVKLNDEMIFSKHEVGRFPENEEILDLIAAKSS